MATAYVAFGPVGLVMNGGPIGIRRGNPSWAGTVTTSGTSAQTADAAEYEGVASIYCDTALYAVVGPDPTASASTGWHIPPATLVEIAISAGDKVALIDV